MTGPIKAPIADRYDRVPNETMRAQLGRRSGLTIARVKAEIKAIGLTCRWNTVYREYRVAWPGPDSEPAAYYTNDPQDAIDTARTMARERAQLLGTLLRLHGI